MRHQPKILYIAPLRDFSGYAHAARDYVRALDALGCDVVTRDLVYDNGSYQRTEREKELANKDLQNVDIVIQQTTPNETAYRNDVFNVNVFCWETDRIPQEWVDKLNMMDLVLVSCEENLRTARRCGVVVPMEKVHYACDLKKYDAKVEPYNIPSMNGHFKFLSICQHSKKKGVDVLLKSYLSEFTPQDGVLLILKIYISPNDGEEQKARIQQLIKAMKDILRLKEYPPILLMHEILDDEGIAKLYKTADCYVLPSRGEGWSVPHFDAMGYGLPTIATNWAGPTEFITKDCGWLVDYNMSPVCDMPHPHDFMYTGKDNWAEPHVCDVRAAMREAHDLWKYDSRRRLSNWRKGNSKWSDMQTQSRARASDFSYSAVGGKLVDTIFKHYKRWKESQCLSI